MRKVYVGGAFASVAAIVASWIAFGLGGTTGGFACPLPNFPDATCTGIPEGTTLTPAEVDVNGDLQVTEDNTVVDSVEVPRCIIVSGSGVTIKNSRMKCVFMEFGSRASDTDNPRMTVQDSELDCDNRDNHAPADPRTAINYTNFNAYRNQITNCENGFDVLTDATIEDNYVYDLWTSSDIDGPHTDGLQSGDGSRVSIQHNTILAFNEGCTPELDAPGGNCNGTAAVNINNSALGPNTTDTDVRHNLLGGGTYTLYCPVPAVTDFRIQGNHFTTEFKSTVGQFGPNADCNPSGGEEVSDNVYHESGLEVPFG